MNPELSIIVFVREDTGSLAACLESLATQQDRDRAEVLLADGSEGGIGAPFAARHPWVRRLALPPGTMPALKGAALAEARGQRVAILDPVDAAGPGWIRAILEGLPDERDEDEDGRSRTAGIGGEVELGGACTTADRAVFLFEYGAFAPPLAAGPTDGDLPGNNVAYRRAALERTCADLLPAGFWKPFFHERLRQAGYELVIHPSMRIRHLTRHRLGAVAARRFHYGRCFGAMRLRGAPAGRRWLYRIGSPALPAILLGRHLRRARARPVTRELLDLRTAIGLAVICTAWGVGETLGYWLGPGDSCAMVY